MKKYPGTWTVTEFYSGSIQSRFHLKFFQSFLVNHQRICPSKKCHLCSYQEVDLLSFQKFGRYAIWNFQLEVIQDVYFYTLYPLFSQWLYEEPILSGLFQPAFSRPKTNWKKKHSYYSVSFIFLFWIQFNCIPASLSILRYLVGVSTLARIEFCAFLLSFELALSLSFVF